MEKNFNATTVNRLGLRVFKDVLLIVKDHKWMVDAIKSANRERIKKSIQTAFFQLVLLIIYVFLFNLKDNEMFIFYFLFQFITVIHTDAFYPLLKKNREEVEKLKRQRKKMTKRKLCDLI